MKSKKSQIGNLPDVYNRNLQKLDNETLERLSNSKEAAMECARKGRMQVKPEKINVENIEQIANEMQILARFLLEQRRVSRKS